MDLERLPIISAPALTELVGWRDAVDALEDALRGGAAPGTTPLRTVVDVSAGQLLLMPAEVGAGVGVKVASARGAAATGAGDLPRIQGVYLLFSAAGLEPLALVDGVALTLLRTASVSALAVRHLCEPGPQRLVVFGTGPQAWAHVQALGAVREISQVTVVGRRSAPAQALVEHCRSVGLAAEPGSADSVRDADLVACCTTAREPVFDSGLLPAHATVVAVGSHEPQVREVDADLVRRATVVVETRASAMAESGDVLLAIAEGVDPDTAVDGEIADLVQGGVRVASGRPRLFKSVGEAWGDLVLARAAYTRLPPPA